MAGHGARSGERWGSMRILSYAYALLFALSSVALLLRFASPPAQQPKTRFRIGYLTNDAEIRKDTSSGSSPRLGYIEGQNLVIEWRFTKKDC